MDPQQRRCAEQRNEGKRDSGSLLSYDLPRSQRPRWERILEAPASLIAMQFHSFNQTPNNDVILNS